jgi:hypothetical protein
MGVVSGPKSVGMANMTEGLLTARLIRVSATNANGFGGNSDVIDCSPFSTLFLIWSCRLQHARVIVNFAETREAAVAQSAMARKVYDVRAWDLGVGTPVTTTGGEPLQVTVPVLGPYCWINVTPGAIPTAYELYLYGCAGDPGIGPQSQTSDSIAQSPSLSYPNGNTTRHATLPYWGPATFFVACGVTTNWSVTVYSTDYTGGFQTTHVLLGPSMAGVYGSANWFLAPLALPPRIIGILISNTTGVAQNFEFALTPARSGI